MSNGKWKVKQPWACGWETVAKNEWREMHPARCDERNEWFANRCAASHLREERGCAAWEHEEVRWMRMQTMLQVWQNNKLIYLNLCHTIATQGKWAGLFFWRAFAKEKISAHWTKPERPCRRAEKLVAGVLKVAEMNEAELCGMKRSSVANDV